MTIEKEGEYAIGGVDERQSLYRRCEAEGVGISVMKAFSGGQLLDAKTSPFGRALTEYQCIQYALDKPGVLTVLPGVRNREDLKRILGFVEAAPEEKDYSVLGNLCSAGGGGNLRVLQPLPALPRWVGCGAHQQILRSGAGRGRAGQKITMPIWKTKPGTVLAAAIVIPVALSMWDRWTDADDPCLFWGITKALLYPI